MRFPQFAVALFLFIVFSARPAHAAPVTLAFDASYDTLGAEVFGVSGSAVPIHYTITIDPMLDTGTQFFATGAVLDGGPTTHPWYGYAASSIVAASLGPEGGDAHHSDVYARIDFVACRHGCSEG